MQVKGSSDVVCGMDWREWGACRDEDPELFFPEGVSARSLAQVEEARAVCASCPVIGTCLEWALSAPERFGVWGGLSEQDRRAILRSRAAVARYVERPTLPTGGFAPRGRVA